MASQVKRILRRGLPGVLLAGLLMGGTVALAQTGKGAIQNPVNVWESLLKAYVTPEGWVDYPAFAAAQESLQVFLDHVAQTPIDSLPRPEALASLINAYNAYTVSSVLEHYPIRSVKDVPGFFKRRQHRVAGKRLSLDDIEKWARGFGDPRVHFVLNCASRSCPKLQRSPFHGDSLEVQLDRATREFLSDPMRGMRIDREEGVIYLSRLFKWYGGDFAKEGGRANLVELALGFLDADKGFNFIKEHYLTEEELRFVESRHPKIVHLKYDWSLNEIPTSPSSADDSSR